MGVTGALSLASGVIGAAGSIYQGISEKNTAEMNAQVYEQQAKNIEEAQKITAQQYGQKANVLRGQAVTTAARNGLRISGTTANSISQSIMELQMDNAYEQYNLEMQKRNAFSNAALQRYQGAAAMQNGIFNAGNTALKAGLNYYDKYWKNETKKEETPKQKKNKLFSGGLLTQQDTLYPTDIARG